MTIDWTRPIETDDGRPAKVLVINISGFSASVATVGHPAKDVGAWLRQIPNLEKQSFTYEYSTDNGSYCGDSNRTRYYGIRNVDDSASFIPEDWS